MDKDTKEKGKEVLARVKEDKVSYISLQFTDLAGRLKDVTIPAHMLPDSLEKGTWFDGSSIEGFARIQESDMLLRPDPATYQVFPWKLAKGKMGRIICDVYQPSGEPLGIDPRFVLKRALDWANAKGLIYNTGSEVEFFLKNPKSGLVHDQASYFDFWTDEGHAIRGDLMEAFEAMGMQVEMAHHEVAPGQHEIDIRFADALTTADNVMTLKATVRAIAREHKLRATFMPKPEAGINGSGMHTHQSLFSRDGKNLFYDGKNPYHLSFLARSFIAGQLKHARALAAVVAPTVNSYKRLVPGYEAPVYISWARRNRSALIRVPEYSPGRENATRAELRFPDPSCNPYLAYAAMLVAGLHGVIKGWQPPAPVEENVYHFTEKELEERSIGTLPETLSEALGELKKDPAVKTALGEAYLPFLRIKQAEWDAYRLYVSPWELEQYSGV
ncbi:MAG: glutamine synthetase family protein [Patescibacteria group bacterium]